MMLSIFTGGYFALAFAAGLFAAGAFATAFGFVAAGFAGTGARAGFFFATASSASISLVA